jgi:hypothetical protein
MPIGKPTIKGNVMNIFKTIKQQYQKINSTPKGRAIFSLAIGLPAVLSNKPETHMPMLYNAFIVLWLAYAAITMAEIKPASYITAEH